LAGAGSCRGLNDPHAELVLGGKRRWCCAPARPCSRLARSSPTVRGPGPSARYRSRSMCRSRPRRRRAGDQVQLVWSVRGPPARCWGDPAATYQAGVQVGQHVPLVPRRDRTERDLRPWRIWLSSHAECDRVPRHPRRRRRRRAGTGPRPGRGTWRAVKRPPLLSDGFLPAHSSHPPPPDLLKAQHLGQVFLPAAGRPRPLPVPGR